MKKFLKKHKKGLAILGGIAIIGLGAYESYEIYEKKREKNQDEIDKYKEEMIALMNAGLMYADEHPDEKVKTNLCVKKDEEKSEHFDPDKRVESL